ncbi:hypothetical protein AKJ16_DCAP08823 [Drosera capensis]
MGCSASSHHHRNSSLDNNPFSTSSSGHHSPAAPPSTAVKSPLVAKTRSLSAPLVHHFPVRKGDSHHLVSLTSTTYGSMSLVDHHVDGRDSTDSKDPSSPESVINTWELMEGLDDDCRVEFSGSGQVKGVDLGGLGENRKVPSSRNGVNSNGLVEKVRDSFVLIEKQIGEVEELGCNGVVSNPNSKPLWKYLSEESLLSKMDPNVSSSYIRALSSRQFGYDRSRVVKSMGSSPCPSFNTKANSVGSSPLVSSLSTNKCQLLEGCEDRIVLYFTSLRGIRRTYEDCCAVRMIFRGFWVHVDERDISMDSMYRKELQIALGGKPMSLPQVFIRGKHIGGAEEIKQLHEVGELAKLLVGFPVRDYAFVCDGCGNARFVPCTSCNGSRKVFEEDEGRLRRCLDCNENGLIRCPACCS